MENEINYDTSYLSIKISSDFWEIFYNVYSKEELWARNAQLGPPIELYFYLFIIQIINIKKKSMGSYDKEFKMELAPDYPCGQKHF